MVPSAAPTGGATAPGGRPDTLDPGARTTGDQGGTSGGVPGWLGHAAVVLLVVLGLLGVPALLRRGVSRRRRPVIAAGGRAGAHAAWAELLDLATDAGLAPTPDRSPRRTAEELLERAPVAGSRRPAVEDAVRALVRAEERARYRLDPALVGVEPVLVGVSVGAGPSVGPSVGAGDTVGSGPLGDEADGADGARLADALAVVRSAVRDGLTPGARRREALLPRAAFGRVTAQAGSRVADGLDALDRVPGALRGRLRRR